MKGESNMTSIELEAQKALLVRDILTDIKDMDMLKIIRHTLDKIIKNKTIEQELAPPCQYTLKEVQLRLQHTEQNALEGKGIRHEDVMKDMDEYLATL